MSYTPFLFAALLACCPAVSGEWVLIGYIDGRGDLAADAGEHTSGMLNLPGGGPVHVQVSGPRGGRWSREGHVTRQATLAQSQPDRTARNLSSFLEWAGARTRGYNRLIVLMGHGVPPTADPDAGAPFLLHGEGDRGIGPRELADTLRRHLPDGPDITTVVILETCYGASADLLYALRAVADFALVAPGEIPSPGLPWPETAQIVTRVVTNPDSGDLQVLSAGRGVDRWPHPWSLALVRLREMDGVGQALRGLCTAASASPGPVAETLLRVRSRTPLSLGRRELVSLTHLARSISRDHPDTTIAKYADRLVAAACAAVTQSATLGASAHRAGDAGQGITAYLPGALSPSVAGYQTWSELGRRTGYDRLIESYVQHCGRLVPGLGPTA